MIRIQGITKSFSGEEVLKGIDASFVPGKCNLIIGLSGSGKTVLLKSIIGLHHQDSGEIYFDDKRQHDMTAKELKLLRQNMGVVFQASALLTSLSVRENVQLPLDFFSNMDDKTKAERVDYCLDRVRIPPEAIDKSPSELSGGMQKRVAIARAIVMNPKYLFCDEPNSGLDPETAIVIDELIKSITLEYNMTTVINTHDMNSVLEIGDNVLLLKNGVKAWEGSSAEILATDDESVVSYVFRSNLFKRVRQAFRDMA